jgi:hypothetical protein
MFASASDWYILVRQVAWEENFQAHFFCDAGRELSEAAAFADQAPYGNGAVIFTQNGRVTRQFARDIRCGSECGCSGSDGLVSVLRMEPVVLW